MEFPEFLEGAWADHAENAGEVLARLPEGIALASEAAHLSALAALAAHVAGEHLGRWGDGLALLARLTEHALFDPESPTGKEVYRAMAALHLGLNDAPAFEDCLRKGRSGGDIPPASDRVRVLAVAASALAGQRRISDAMRWFQEALAVAAYGPRRGDPAAQALAETGSDLACTFEDLRHRTPAEAELMKLAAATARRYWEIAGDWTDVERAEHRLARTYLEAGEPRVALRHAETCLAICEANDALAGERFLAHEARARSLHALGEAAAARDARDRAAALLDDVAEDHRAHCRRELAGLDALLRG